MRKKNYKGRVTKRYLPKCNDICRTYDPIMTAYADLLSKLEEVKEFRCNVYLEGLTEGDYTTDFLVKMKDGTFMVRECVYRSRITKPMHYKLLLQWETSGDGTHGYEKVFRVPSPFSLYRNTRSRKGVAAVWQAVELKAPGSWDI